jgi:hypothetical protein
MRVRLSTVAAVTACVLMSSALALCTQESRDESELRRYTPLQIRAARATEPKPLPAPTDEPTAVTSR